MAILSHRSTYISNLELGSDQAYITDAYLKIPSDGTLETAGATTQSGTLTNSGTFTNTGTVNLGTTVTKSVDTTVPASAGYLADGQLSLVSHSGNSIHIAFRSGATVYYWLNSNVST